MKPVYKAVWWMLGSMLSFSLMAVGGREIASQLDTAQTLFYRSVIGLFIMLPIVSYHGWSQLRSRILPVHLVRNLAHFGGQYGWFYALGLLPLAEVVAIEFTVPVWTAILATLLLREHLSAPRLWAVGLGLLGMWIILRPGIAIVQPAALAVLFGAMGYGLSHTLTRRLAEEDTPMAIVFYMVIIQLPIAYAASGGDLAQPSSPGQWGWLVLVGITALSAHYCMANALRHADATVAVPMDFLRLPLIAVVGFLFYGEGVSAYVFIGALFMMLGNWLNIRSERNR